MRPLNYDYKNAPGTKDTAVTCYLLSRPPFNTQSIVIAIVSASEPALATNIGQSVDMEIMTFLAKSAPVPSAIPIHIAISVPIAGTIRVGSELVIDVHRALKTRQGQPYSIDQHKKGYETPI